MVTRGPFKLHVVMKSDVGVGAPYLVGAFMQKPLAVAACRGPGRFTIATVDANRAYPQGQLLNVDVIENLTVGSLGVEP